MGVCRRRLHPTDLREKVQARAETLAAGSDRPLDAKEFPLTPLKRTADETGYRYDHVEATVDATERTATITVRAPEGEIPSDLDAIHAAGANWWPLAMARQLDDAILMLRTNTPEVGTFLSARKASPVRCLNAMSLLSVSPMTGSCAR